MIEQILQADRYLQVDQVERARDMYQRVVDMDPGNAIAVVGLARCALADGEDERAYELASRALDIDPENDMARRMEARLSEILASRGRPVERPTAAATPAPREMRAVVTQEVPATDAAAPGNASTAPTPQAPTPQTPTPQAATPRAATPRAATPQASATLDQPSPPAQPPGHPSTSTRSPKERPVRKSLFDRLMGR